MTRAPDCRLPTAHCRASGARPLLILAAPPHGGAGLVATMLAAGGVPVVEAAALTGAGGARGVAVVVREPMAVPVVAALAWPRLAVVVERGLVAHARRRMGALLTARPELAAAGAAPPSAAVVAAHRAQEAMRRAVKASGTPLIRIAFEAALDDPHAAARTLAATLAPWWPALDAAAMAAAVRSPAAAAPLAAL